MPRRTASWLAWMHSVLALRPGGLVLAGREKNDVVQAGAGVRMYAKPGAVVRAGEPLMPLLTDTPERFERAKEALADAVTIAPEGSRPANQLIMDRIA